MGLQIKFTVFASLINFCVSLLGPASVLSAQEFENPNNSIFRKHSILSFIVSRWHYSSSILAKRIENIVEKSEYGSSWRQNYSIHFLNPLFKTLHYIILPSSVPAPAKLD